MAINVDESASSSAQEESDDSKDSGRLSQDEAHEEVAVAVAQEAAKEESAMTDTSDNGITFGRKLSANGVVESSAPETAGEDASLHDEVGGGGGSGGGTDELDRRMSTDGGFEAAVTTTEEDQEESCLLGIDCNELSTVGLVLRIYADTKIHLDGDG